MIREEWKPVKDWEDRYEVNSFGDVRSLKTGKLLKGDINNCGYYRVRLESTNPKRRKRYFRHRIVAEHFLENDDPINKKFVNHIDGDKSNNAVSNIEWCTQSENEKHAFRTGLKKTTNKPFIVEFIDGSIIKYENQRKLAYELGVTQPIVSHWLRQNTKAYEDFNIKNIYFIQQDNMY